MATTRRINPLYAQQQMRTADLYARQRANNPDDTTPMSRVETDWGKGGALRQRFMNRGTTTGGGQTGRTTPRRNRGIANLAQRNAASTRSNLTPGTGGNILRNAMKVRPPLQSQTQVLRQGAPSQPVDLTRTTVRPSAYSPNTIEAPTALRLPSIDDFGAETQRVQDATWERAKYMLDPVFDREQKRIDVQLANQGLPMGSEAYEDRLDQFNRRKGEAYTQGALAALLAGSGEHSRLLGEGRANIGQQFGQDLARSQFEQSEDARQFGQDLADRGFMQSELARLYGQDLGDRRFDQSEASRLYGQDLGSRRFTQSEDQRLFDKSLTARNQALNEMQLQRNDAFRNLIALLSGTPAIQNPQFAPQMGIRVNPSQYDQYRANYDRMQAANQGGFI